MTTCCNPGTLQSTYYTRQVLIHLSHEEPEIQKVNGVISNTQWIECYPFTRLH